MTVAELIEILQELPQDYTVTASTQDTITVDIDRSLFGDIEVGDTIKTISLR